MDWGVFPTWLAVDSATLYYLAESAVRVAVLLGLTYLLLAALRHRSPTFRHLCLRLAIAATLLLPLLAAVTPEWRLALPGSLHSAWSVVMPGLDVPAGGKAADQFGPVSLNWQTFAAAIWLLGAVLVLARIAVGMTLTFVILRRSQQIAAADHLEMIDGLKIALGIAREVRVVVSDRASAPIVWHLRRPTVILPPEARNWPDEKLRMTLLHELAHTKRHDGMWIIVGSLLTAFHWYNPLAWWARKRLVIEAEKACDDHVLYHGADALGYAEHLVELVRRMRGRLALAPLGAEIAGKKQLEGRVMSILGNRRNSLLVKRSAWGMAIGFACMLVPLAGLQLNAATQTSDSPAIRGISGSEPDSDESLPKPDEFVTVSTMPEALKFEEPTYPDSAKNAGLTGVTWVKALVDSMGTVRDAQLHKSSGYKILDDAALKAALLNKYKPATLDDKPVAVWISYPVNFMLDESKAKEKTGE